MKIGDRVRITSTYYSSIPIGSTGIITRLGDQHIYFLVRLDGPLHQGNDWNFSLDEFERISGIDRVLNEL